MSEKYSTLLELASKATPGPWAQSHRKKSNDMYGTEIYDAHGIDIAEISWYPIHYPDGSTSTARDENAAFIAACDPQTIIALIDRCLAAEKRSAESNTLAYKWMVAHDRLKAGLDYEFPSPADLPKAIARAEQAESALKEAREALKPFAEEACKIPTSVRDGTLLDCPGCEISAGDLRRAAEAIATGEGKDES